MKTTSTSRALLKGTYYSTTVLLFSLCTKVAQQSKDKRGKSTNKQSTLFKNYYDETTLK
jgi:hypothetical protein